MRRDSTLWLMNLMENDVLPYAPNLQNDGSEADTVKTNSFGFHNSRVRLRSFFISLLQKEFVCKLQKNFTKLR